MDYGISILQQLLIIFLNPFKNMIRRNIENTCFSYIKKMLGMGL